MGGSVASCQRSCETTCVEHVGVDIYALTHSQSLSSHPDGDLQGSEAMSVHKLLIAAKEGREEQLALLLTDGAAVDRRRPFFMKREQEVIDKEQTANTGRLRQHGMTALMYAAQAGHPGCCARLLVARASPNTEDEDGLRPLHFAASSGNLEVCLLLIEYGASVQARTDDGSCAFDFVPDDAMPNAKLYQKWRNVLAVPDSVPAPPPSNWTLGPDGEAKNDEGDTVSDPAATLNKGPDDGKVDGDAATKDDQASPPKREANGSANTKDLLVHEEGDASGDALKKDPTAISDERKDHSDVAAAIQD